MRPEAWFSVLRRETKKKLRRRTRRRPRPRTACRSTRYRRPTPSACSPTPICLGCSAPRSSTRSLVLLLLVLDHLVLLLHLRAFRRAAPVHFGPRKDAVFVMARGGAIDGREWTATVAACASRSGSVCGPVYIRHHPTTLVHLAHAASRSTSSTRPRLLLHLLGQCAPP